jgi:hypothetical protein
MTTYDTSNESKTLAHRLGEGRLAVQEALRYAMILAEALRKIHDSGHAHGAVSTDTIVLTPAGLELLSALPGSAGNFTPYTAPEVLQGHPADARSDIFSFGAILHELLTGRRVFDGGDLATLAAAITHSPTPSSGSPVVDRLVGACLVKDPLARCPRMQKVIMELKLLAVAARRADSAATATRRDFVDAAAMRAEIDQLEARIAARLAEHEKATAEIQRNATEALGTLREQLSSVSADLAAAQQRTARAEQSLDAIGERILARVDRGFEAAGEHIGRVEKGLEDVRQHDASFEQSVAADLHDLEQQLKAHGVSIESARTAMSQTDDLVERVVEALESLQSTVLDQTELSEDRAALAVN